MRKEPIEGEEVTLVVSAESDEQSAVASVEAQIEGVGGTVEKWLQFGALRVVIAQEDIDALCNIDGIEKVETANAIGVDGDAGEDL